MTNYDVDVIIIGAGAAGLTAGQYAARANLQTVIIEQMAPGGQALLIDKLENYPGNVAHKTGMEFSDDMKKQAEDFGAKIISDSVESIKKEDHTFFVTLGDDTVLKSPTVIIATGAKHRGLNVPGESEFYGRGVSYCAVCDGPFFKNKKILVVGGGDSACDEGMFLSNLTEEVILVHRKDRFRAQRGLAERVLKHQHIDVRFNSRLVEIKGEKKVSSVIIENINDGSHYEEAVDAVFIFVGSDPQTQLVPFVEKDDGGYIITDELKQTSVPGLYAAGDVRSSPFRQVVTAAADGAIAAHSASQYIDELKGETYN
jgi:thioredoxin reductase (NADPH)